MPPCDTDDVNSKPIPPVLNANKSLGFFKHAFEVFLVRVVFSSFNFRHSQQYAFLARQKQTDKNFTSTINLNTEIET